MNLKGKWSSAAKFFFFFFSSQCVNYMCEGVTRGQSRPNDLKSSFILSYLGTAGPPTPGDSATRITGIARGPIFSRRAAEMCACGQKFLTYGFPMPPWLSINARGTAGDNRVNCNRIPRAAVYDIPPAPPGDSAGEKIALIATGLKLLSVSIHDGECRW